LPVALDTFEPSIGVGIGGVGFWSSLLFSLVSFLELAVLVSVVCPGIGMGASQMASNTAIIAKRLIMHKIYHKQVAHLGLLNQNGGLIPTVIVTGDS
jgi:hypothetical protein